MYFIIFCSSTYECCYYIIIYVYYSDLPIKNGKVYIEKVITFVYWRLFNSFIIFSIKLDSV